MTARITTSRTLTTLVLTLMITVLAGCTSPADPDDITWELVAEGDIVALDDSTGVYVQGYLYRGTGEIESKGVIDYKYAYLLEDGGIRQGLITELWGKLTTYDYPGSSVVTIYQDVEPDVSPSTADGQPSAASRIEVFRCHPPKGAYCVMPDGSAMSGADLRVDMHVPSGAVVDTTSLEPGEEGEPAS